MKEDEKADDNTDAEGGELCHRSDEDESQIYQTNPIGAERDDSADDPSKGSVKHQLPPPRFPTPPQYSLYYTLLWQHMRQLMPVRSAEQTVAQLHRYFEDVVLENNLSALVVEGIASEPERSLRDVARIREVGRAARYSFLFVSPNDGLNRLWPDSRREERSPAMLLTTLNADFEERFIVIADARFSALLASVHTRDASERDDDGDEMIWTFDPDIVYSALEYLMARVKAEYPSQAASFLKAVGRSIPKTTSLQLIASVTTKLASLLQRQAEREVAVNRIAAAIRSSLELPSVLQTTVDEVGRALWCATSALSITDDDGQPSLMSFYFRDGEGDESFREELIGDLNAYVARLGGRVKSYVLDGVMGAGEGSTRPVAVVPVIYGERMIGALLASSDEPNRVWQENEIMLMRTVSNQVAVAVSHARLFNKMMQQALTDGLTGCVNRRSFEMQLERDLHLATRMRQPVSLIMLDIDHFKQLNDTHGHDAGDAALRVTADALRQELRGVDTAARYGGEEFAIILPQASLEGGLYTAERLRARVEQTEVANVGHITASVGVATFPYHASSRDLLVTTADRALYYAKLTGRNRVCAPPDIPGE